MTAEQIRAAKAEVDAARVPVTQREELREQHLQQQPEVQTKIPSWWSVTDAMTISAAILVFGFLVLLLAAYLVRHGKSSDSVLRMFGTVLIIVIAVFLVVAGYDNNQIAPVMGLLGTIAGYLLGRNDRDQRRSDQAPVELAPSVEEPPVAGAEQSRLPAR